VTNGTATYTKPGRKLRQGDIALCEFHQLRARSGEGRGPGPADAANEDLPYFGEPQVFEVPVVIPGRDSPLVRELRVWFGYAITVHQSCEIEYADQQDSRLIVAPITSPALWSNGPWELIRKGSLPGFFYLPSLDAEAASALGLPGAWPEAAVALASTTQVSRAMVQPNRKLALTAPGIVALQEAVVRFMSVRGWGTIEDAQALQGLRVVSARETPEMVPGPSRLTKVLLEGENGVDEITVVCGLRPSRRRAA
jgi:hypothetical protein